MGRPLAGYIGHDRIPSTTAAAGVWDLQDIARYKRQSSWPGADPFASYVRVLLHFDGEAKNFVDSAPSAGLYGGRTFVSETSGTQSATQSKFGGKSLTGGLSCTSDTSEFDLSAGDWALEAWVFLTAATTSNALSIGSSNPSSTQPLVFKVTSSSTFQFWRSGASVATTSQVSLNTWYHLAVSRSGGDNFFYLNGQLVSQTTGAFGTDGQSIHMGRTQNSQAFNGYIDEVRFTKGVARYTANFTPSEVAF